MSGGRHCEVGRQASRAAGFSLLELAAVAALMGVVALAVVGRFCTGTLENCSADGYARTLATDLLQARRRTIATGDNHYLSLTVASGKVTSYVMYRSQTPTPQVVDATRTTPAGVTVTASHTTLEYDFDGAALAAYVISVAGPSRTWTITVTLATGAVHTTVSP